MTAKKKVKRRPRSPPVKDIYDNVLGFIPLTEIELDIINDPVFQRLKRIQQLGNAHYVFPGATHTRFAHSLGVMQIAGILGDKLKVECGWAGEDCEKLRLAGLLHDVGHYPFSHTVEDFYANEARELDHETMSQRIIKQTSLKDIVNRKFTTTEISKIFLSQHRDLRYNQILSSELDADRMDYLLRDSYHTGVRFGLFDFDQLVRKICLAKKGYICIDYRATRAAEHYTLARFNMYAQVYSHKTIRSFDLLLRRLLHYGIEENVFPEPGTLIEWMNKDDFSLFDDYSILTGVKRLMRSEKTVARRMAQMYINRVPLKLAFGNSCFIPRDGDMKPEQLSRLVMFMEEHSGSSRIGNVPIEWVFFDRVDDLSITKLRPLMEIGEVLGRSSNSGSSSSGEEYDSLEPSQLIWIRNKDLSCNPLLTERSSLLKELGGIQYEIWRVYTLDKYKEGLRLHLEKKIGG